MTTVLGIIFLMVYLFAPNRGLIAMMFQQKKQKIEISLITFLLHLNNHQEDSERELQHLQEHFNWSKSYADEVVDFALKNNMVKIERSEEHTSELQSRGH